MNRIFSGLFLILSIAQFLYTYFYPYGMQTYDMPCALALIGLLGHFVFAKKLKDSGD